MRQQALLVLAYLRKGETFAELAVRLGVGITTAWRFVEEIGNRQAPLRLRTGRQAAHSVRHSRVTSRS